MAQVITTTANKPAWVDLASGDAEASRSFYSKLFGWQVEVNPDPQYGGYGIAKTGGKEVTTSTASTSAPARTPTAPVPAPAPVETPAPATAPAVTPPPASETPTATTAAAKLKKERFSGKVVSVDTTASTLVVHGKADQTFTVTSATKITGGTLATLAAGAKVSGTYTKSADGATLTLATLKITP